MAVFFNLFQICFLFIFSQSINKYKQQMNRQAWTQEQDNTIQKLVEEVGLNDWSQVAASLKTKYPYSRRTGKQCRERWYNHLSPAVSKLPWSTLEQQKLFQMHKLLGNRWKDISKSFPGRSDNDIKNHFYSTLRRSLRRLNKILGQRNSTSQMREIKPSVLTTIISFNYKSNKLQNDYKKGMNNIEDLPSLIFEFANFKPGKKTPSPANIEDFKDKITQIFQLISQFNEEYQHLKSHGRKSKPQKTEKLNPKQKKIKQTTYKQQSTPRDELQKEILNTQIWIKEEPDSLVDHFEFILEKFRQEEKKQTQISLKEEQSQWPLQVEEHNIEFCDPQEPSKISQLPQNQPLIMREDSFKQYNYNYEVEAQLDIWADQIHL